MKYSFVLLLLLKAMPVFSQTARKVLDSQTMTVIAFATIKVLNKPSGVIASEKGEFNLNIDPTDSVLVSCVGYEPRILIGKNIEAVIYLDKKIKTLKEVAVRERKLIRSIVLGNGVAYLDSNIRCPLTAATDMQTANCIPWGPGGKAEHAEKIELPSSDLTYKIKKIIIPLSRTKCWGSVLLHLYYEDSSSENPGEEFFLKQITIEKHIVKKNKVFIDLSTESIYLPVSKFFFIGISWPDEKQECTATLPLIKSNKTNTFKRVLVSDNYNWHRSVLVKWENDGPLLNYSTFYAVVLDEMK